ncbi:MAG: ribosome assembly cofactor RimP [Muribaculaceae bacterium]|nr:ribosome assembly cofactor RimP [Muribaculaceae bacterium]
MIDKELLKQSVEKAIEGTGLFIVDIKVSAQNDIVVELDSPEAMDIDTCAKVTRAIEADFDRDVEDYQLEVGSAGLTSPFKVRGQYEKNIGNDIEILTRDGRKLTATLTAVTDEGFTFEYPVKVKEPGVKKPVIRMQSETLPYDGAKSVRYHISFK